ncbi:MAG: hypothetical protein ACKO2G_07985 [Verrucomicrobiales bacterium]
MRTIPTSVLFLCTAILVSAVAGEETKPSSEADAFRAAAGRCLKELRAEPVSGVPNDAQLRRLAPHISPGLLAGFRQAAMIRDREAAANPDEKPSFVEGDFFSSLTEGATSWKLGESHLLPGVLPSIEIQQGYKDEQGNFENWVDLYVFLPQNGTWILEDILMGGEWAADSTLRGSLPGGLREEADHLSPDGKWSFTFTMGGDAVAGMSVQAADGKAKAQLLFKEAGDRCLSFRTEVIWSADSKHFTIRLGDGPRVARTEVYQLRDDRWVKVALPQPFKEEKATALGNGFTQLYDTLEPLYWRDEKTLILACIMTWEKGEEGDGLGKMVVVDVSQKVPAIVSTMELLSPPKEKK